MNYLFVSVRLFISPIKNGIEQHRLFPQLPCITYVFPPPQISLRCGTGITIFTHPSSTYFIPDYSSPQICLCLCFSVCVCVCTGKLCRIQKRKRKKEIEGLSFFFLIMMMLCRSYVSAFFHAAYPPISKLPNTPLNI